MLGSVLGGTADEPDPHAVDVATGGELPDEPKPEPFDPADIEDLDATIGTLRAIVDVAEDAIEDLEAEAERRARDERLNPFDVPPDWQRDASAFGEDFIEAVLRTYDHLRERGDATTEEIYRIYRGAVPAAAISRQRFGVEFAPVLAEADGIEARLYRVDPDEALTGDAIDAAADEPTFRFEFGAETLAAMYRTLADAGPHGMTRLGLVEAARRRANVAISQGFAGPQDPDDLDDGQDLHEFEGLAALLDMPGVLPPDEPAWRWARGESDG